MSVSSRGLHDFHTPNIGCGLVRIGRVWGTKKMKVPREAEAVRFLKEAFKAGIRVFDTAPAYGKSEEYLGKFLDTLSAAQRQECFIATKCGEEYDFDSGATRIDHSLSGIERSIERSFKRLSRVSLLQIHKATPALISDKAMLRLLARYKDKIPFMGVCATDIKTAECALAVPFFDFIQFPYNRDHPELRPLFARAWKAGKTVFISRPFASGALFADRHIPSGAEREIIRDSLAFILKEMKWGGVVLVGTNNAEHLRENIKLCNESRTKSRPVRNI